MNIINQEPIDNFVLIMVESDYYVIVRQSIRNIALLTVKINTAHSNNALKKQKYVNFQISSGYGPQWTAVHGHASHPLWDVIQKSRAGYRGTGPPRAT